MTHEERRLEDNRSKNAHWQRWGPYLSERAWGTVREDYSPYGNAWEYLPHDHARSRAYRWNEDGIAGISDRHQHICFALAMWNGRDPILEERLFGLTGNEGNHGEDVKECYFYLDSTPTHSYMKYLYKYPHAEFPYSQLVEENRRRGRQSAEFELKDTGVFAGGRYFDVQVEYAKATCDRLEGFKRRLEWFIENRSDLTANVACMKSPGEGERRLLSIVSQDQLRRVLEVMLDEREFLSPFGIRALSAVYREHPYTMRVNGNEYRVDYEPGESSTGLFGGNSNWRGPIWFPVNFLLVESLQKFHHYLGDSFRVECPTGSGRMMTLWEVAAEISRRMTHIFLKDADGRRPVHGDDALYRDDPNWQDLVLFYEYFHGDTGRGVGASHQTGWTGLIGKLLQQSGERRETPVEESVELAAAVVE